MPGVKGAGGPPPKRSDQRRRSNKTAAEERAAVATVGEAIPAEAPAAGEWASGITAWYVSLSRSGQSSWYSASDWASAWLMADLMNTELVAEGSVKSATLANWLKLNAALLATEGDRRRAALELQRPKPVEPEQTGSVTSIASWKAGLSG